MGGLLSKNINDPELHPWIITAFRTSRAQDRGMASVNMIRALQKYFAYGCGICCALPSVTLLGEKADWLCDSTTPQPVPFLTRAQRSPEA